LLPVIHSLPVSRRLLPVSRRLPVIHSLPASRRLLPVRRRLPVSRLLLPVDCRSVRYRQCRAG
jgi:hypothetical protein